MNKHITHPHPPVYDQDGHLICCTLEEKIDAKTPPPIAPREEQYNLDKDHDHSHDHAHGTESIWKTYLPASFSFFLLTAGLLIEHFTPFNFLEGWVKIIWYTVAYIPVGWPVMKEAIEALQKGEIFTEFFLMSIATLGAFAIGEYPEGVAVMLFYTVGELFQMAAVKRAKNNIVALLDVRPKIAHVFRDNTYNSVHPSSVMVGEIIQVKVGEKIPLDGHLKSQNATLNTAALTGESKPLYVEQGENVLAGSINLQGVITVEVGKLFQDSSIARILELVQNATSRKSKTELLIRRLAKIYTPIVVYLAIAICILPFLFVSDYVFQDWLYRALIFLVISCPCALVISIPLGYFGGLGAASKNGILFKGATFLDQITKVNTLVMDKTGTVTKGVFKIVEIKVLDNYSEAQLMKYLMALEAKSTHPIAKAIMNDRQGGELLEAREVKEISGMGLTGYVEDQFIVAGNVKLMQHQNISFPAEIEDIVETTVLVGIDGSLAGYVIIADELKEDAVESIHHLRAAGIRNLMMLSGDKHAITLQVANELGIENAKGGLLPEDKLEEVLKFKEGTNHIVGFVGDGINDAPVLAASDVGIAMGAMGSDVAIETADIIIQTDQPSKIATGIKIGKATQRIIWQNIGLAFGVKFIVLILGAGGLATMWEAVFADVGVALLAILNAIRLQRMSWDG